MEKGVFWKRGLLKNVHFLEILENLEILEFLEFLEFLENPQTTVEKKEEPDHLLETLENLEILEILGISPLEKTPFVITPFSGPLWRLLGPRVGPRVSGSPREHLLILLSLLQEVPTKRPTKVSTEPKGPAVLKMFKERFSGRA